MGMKLNEIKEEQRRFFRFVLVGSGIGVLAAYSLLIPAKLVGVYPERWSRIAAGPVLLFSLLVATHWVSTRVCLWEARQAVRRAGFTGRGVWDRELD